MLIFCRVTVELEIVRTLGSKGSASWIRCQPIGKAQLHTVTEQILHYGQLRNASQPTTHVFGMSKQTRLLRGNPLLLGV